MFGILNKGPAVPAPAADPDLLTRFATIGGAVVELRRYRFRTRYTYQGRPFASDTARDCDGYRWVCLGCGRKDSEVRFFGEPYLDCEAAEARDDANGHAASCRAMPRDPQQMGSTP